MMTIPSIDLGSALIDASPSVSVPGAEVAVVNDSPRQASISFDLQNSKSMAGIRPEVVECFQAALGKPLADNEKLQKCLQNCVKEIADKVEIVGASPIDAVVVEPSKTIENAVVENSRMPHGASSVVEVPVSFKSTVGIERSVVVDKSIAENLLPATEIKVLNGNLVVEKLGIVGKPLPAVRSPVVEVPVVVEETVVEKARTVVVEMPLSSKASSVGEEPLPIEKPAVAVGTVVVESPASSNPSPVVNVPLSSEKTVAAEGQVVVEKLVSSNPPSVIEVPLMVGKPAVASVAVVVENSASSNPSPVVNVPVPSEKTVAAEGQVVVEKLVSSNPPSVVEVPMTVEKPAVASVAVVVEKPASSNPSPVVNVPVPSEKPVAADVPVVVEKPMSASQPLVVEVPVIVEKPVVPVDTVVVARSEASNLSSAVEMPATAEKPVVAAGTVGVEKTGIIDKSIPLKRSFVLDETNVPPDISAFVQPKAVASPVDLTIPNQEIQAIDAVSARTLENVANVRRVMNASDVLVETARVVADTIMVTPGLLRGQGEVRIRLRPDVLDGTEVRVAVTGRHLSVEFLPVVHDAAVLIETNRAQLEQYLAGRIHAFSIGVSVKANVMADRHARKINDEERI